MAKAETRSEPTRRLKNPKSKAGATKASSLRTHNITLQVGASIVIDPAGEKLVIKQIDGDQITFEQDHAEPEYGA